MKQTTVTDQATQVAQVIKNTAAKKREAVLKQELSQWKLPPYFQVTINPTFMAKGLILDKCKYMESKTVRICQYIIF